MRRSTIVAGVCLLSLSGILVLVVAAQQPGSASEHTATQIKALQKERSEALERVVAISTSQYQGGMLPFESVASAQRDLLSALLESTDKPEDRIALLTRQLENAANVLKIAEQRFQNGATTNADVYRAKAHYLGVKVKLLQERSEVK
jgi:outer membrane protein TolC